MIVPVRVTGSKVEDAVPSYHHSIGECCRPHWEECFCTCLNALTPTVAIWVQLWSILFQTELSL